MDEETNVWVVTWVTQSTDWVSDKALSQTQVFSHQIWGSFPLFCVLGSLTWTKESYSGKGRFPLCIFPQSTWGFFS